MTGCLLGIQEIAFKWRKMSLQTYLNIKWWSPTRNIPWRNSWESIKKPIHLPGLFKMFSLISIGNSYACWQIPLKAILPSLSVGSCGVPTVTSEFDPKLAKCCTKGHQLSDQHMSYRGFSFWEEKNKIKFKNAICHKAFGETASLMCKSQLEG